MKYGHYLKECKFEKIDIYRILEMYNVTSPAIQHSVKKLLVAGGRGAKDAKKDVEEAIDSLVRWLEMRREESGENLQGNDLKVSICDTMNLADSFLYDIRQTELSWGEHHEARMDVIGQNGPTGEHYNVDAWIFHRGGRQPVANNCMVDVCFADGGQAFNQPAGGWIWDVSHGDAAIVAYRIRNEIYNDDEEALL